MSIPKMPWPGRQQEKAKMAFRDRDSIPIPTFCYLVLISVSLFNKVGFIIIPIATSITTWIGVIVYIYSLNKKNLINIETNLYKSFIKVILNAILMSFILLFALEYYSYYLDYDYKYKSVYLLLIVGFVTVFYLISCYFTGLLKTKKFKVN